MKTGMGNPPKPKEKHSHKQTCYKTVFLYWTGHPWPANR